LDSFFVLDGIHPDIVADVAKEVEKSCPKRFQRLFILAFDEIYIKKNLVFRNSTGEMVGNVKLDEVDRKLAALDAEVEDKVLEKKTPAVEQLPVATKMLSYLVTGVCNNIKSVVACYGAANMTSESLDRLTWDVVAALEVNGMEVIAMVADNASTNRRFFQSQKVMPGYGEGAKAVYCTPNRYDLDRPVFLLTDPPHLLKTTRNCLYSSGRKRTNGKGYIRLLTKNGQRILWDTVLQLYNTEMKNTLKKYYKIKQGDVQLNSYSIMKVNSAAHILSQTTVDAARDNGWTDAEEFAVLCEKVNAAFEMLNGTYSDEGRRKRNYRLNTYESLEDQRFEELLEIWDYFDEWKAEIDRQYPEKQRNHYLLSVQTHEGWERTLKGFHGAVRYALAVAEASGDKAFINARKLSQDDLEHYYGKQRAKTGSNTHPSLHEALRSNVQMHVQRKLSFKGGKKGTTAVNTAISLEDLSAPLQKRPRGGSK